jgi:hypothetical protein
MTKKCKSCKTEIDAKATKCPNCQTDQRGWFRRHPILTGLLVLFAFGIIISVISGVSTSGKSASAAPDNTTTKTTNSNTQSQPTVTQATQTPEKPKSWVTITTASGDSDKRTDTFALHGSKTRLTYTFTGGETLVGSIYVMKDGTSLEKDGGFPEVTVEKSGTDSTYLTKDAGNYYLDVKAANASWTVKIEEEQ